MEKILLPLGPELRTLKIINKSQLLENQLNQTSPLFLSMMNWRPVILKGSIAIKGVKENAVPLVHEIESLYEVKEIPTDSFQKFNTLFFQVNKTMEILSTLKELQNHYPDYHFYLTTYNPVSFE